MEMTDLSINALFYGQESGCVYVGTQHTSREPEYPWYQGMLRMQQLRFFNEATR